MNKTEIQARIKKCESELATLKADLAKCDCADGIEQKKCWHVVYKDGTSGWISFTKKDAEEIVTANKNMRHAAYMPECRQVTAEDALDVWSAYCRTSTSWDMARELHKLGFRMKVTP